jgi:hypothetical protein
MRRKSFLSNPRCITPTAGPDKIQFAFARPKDGFYDRPHLFPLPSAFAFASARSRRSTAKTDRRGHCCERFLNIWMLVARILLTVNWKWGGKRFTFSWGRLEPFGKRRNKFGEAKGRKAERTGTSESTSG